MMNNNFVHPMAMKLVGFILSNNKSVMRYLIQFFGAHTFACNGQQPFLNKPKEENDRRYYFMINIHESMGPLTTPRSAVRRITDYTNGPG